MKKLLKSFAFVLFFAEGACSTSGLDMYRYNVDFDVSMGKGGLCYAQCLKSYGMYSLAVQPVIELLNLFRNLYEKNNLFRVAVKKKEKIPKIVHHIWLGGELPASYRRLRQTWIDIHPDWVFVLWTDNSVNYKEGTKVLQGEQEFKDYLEKGVSPGDELVVDVHGINLHNQLFFDQSTNYGERSDLLRYELIYRYGGVYLDTDMECLKRLDVFNHSYDFYIGIQPLDVRVLALGIGIFGSVPGHPILKHCIDTIRDYRHLDAIWMRTGPVHLTRSFFAVAPLCEGINIVFPSTYFYPVGITHKNLRREQMDKMIKQESFSLHLWGASWTTKATPMGYKSAATDEFLDYLVVWR